MSDFKPDPDRVAAYEAKQERKRERLYRAADRATAHSVSAERRARVIYDVIPFGQPILVGHHSEKRHRRDLERARDAMTRRFMESDKAMKYRRRADGIGTGGISSDDPSAIEKLQAELARVTEQLAVEKRVNAQLRKLDKARAKELGHEPTKADRLAMVERLDTTEDIKIRLRSLVHVLSWLPQFHVVNTNANRRRIEDRIKALQLRDAAPARESIVGDGWRIDEDRDENRVQIRFDAKPASDVIARLMSHGFRWARSLGVWQRQLNEAAWRAARYVMGVVS